MKIDAIIQARLSSTRLPEKVLKKLPYDSDITVLEQVIKRVKISQKIDDIIIATTLGSEDDKIVDIAKKESVKWFRGSKEDLLSRYYFAAKENKSDLIVRITSDCPCIDWNVIDFCIDRHLNDSADYTSNTIKRTYPHGLDVEIISFSALEKAYFEAKESFEREHVCPYIHTTHKDSFKISFVEAPLELTDPEIRITVDTEEDYALVCAVYDYLFYKNNFFDAHDIVKLFKDKQWLRLINKKVSQKKIFLNINDEIEEAKKVLKLQDLHNVAKMLDEIKI
jgi:spore coat polysaccharide biosynthesis protein SpsF